MLKQSPTIILALAPRRFYLLALILCLFLFFLLVPNRVSTQAPETCVQPPSGIIAWWPMDETSGTNVADIVGNNPGVHVNGPAPAVGQVDGALRFDGVNDYVGIGDSDLWAFGSNDFTIDLWANFDTPGGGSIGHPGDIFIGSDEGPGTQNKWFFALGGGVLNFHINGPGTGSFFLVQAPFSPNVGQWYHLAVTRNGNTYMIFVDGIPVGSEVNTVAIPNANAPLTIGQAEELGFMNGLLDEVTIYNRALTQGELQAIFNAGSAGKCKSLSISTKGLSAIQLGTFSTQQLEARFGSAPFSWSLVIGTLPSGMTLTSDGVLSGTPTEAGSFPVTIRVTDSLNAIAERKFALDVLLVPPPPNVRVGKTGTLAVPGRTIDYFILVENLGNTTAENIVAVEVLDPPSFFNLTSATPSPRTVVDQAVIEWLVEHLEPGQAEILSYSVRLDSAIPIGTNILGAVWLCPSGFCPIPSTLAINLNNALTAGPPNCRDCINNNCGLALSVCRERTCNIGPCHFYYENCSARCSAQCEGFLPEVQLIGSPDRCYDDDRHNQPARGAVDPNEKEVVAKRFIQPDQLLVYPVHFENIGDVEARDVFVTDGLDPNLDASTLNLLTPTGGSFDVTTRMVRWDLLNTNLQPGETGNVLLSVRPRPGLPSGTVIRNKAKIQFEVFPPILTNEVVNIIDSTRPASLMNPLPAETSTLDFPISWSGSDAVGEIDFYSILVSVDGSSFTPILERTREMNATFRGELGKTYAFIAIATDTAGNIEIQDATTEASTRIVGADCAAGGDTEDPTITAPPAVTLYTGPGATSCGVTVNDLDTALGIASTSDNCPGVTVARSGVPVGNVFSVGQTTITHTATDASGNTATATQTVTVIDNTPPNITSESANPASLWPPNHTMRDVNVNYTAVDNCSSNCTLTVTSNEPENGTGDGDTAPDWEVIDPHHVRLRAERAALGNGRIYTITITCRDDASNATSRNVTVFVAHNITGPTSGTAFKIGTSVNFAGTFWDVPGRTHTAQWTFDDALSTAGKVVEPSGSKPGTVTGTYAFTTPGVYQIKLKVTDSSGQTSWVDTAGDVEAIVVIYDPNGGYTIGGGYIATPAGSYPADPSKIRKFSFGFNSKYANATNPKGETQIHFAEGGLEFNALNYDYLAMSGARAQFRGFGKVNGESGYNFILTVIDGQLKGGGGVDKFRIKIWNKTTGAIIFDSQMGASDAADPSTPVGTGSSIVIQK